jgi:hypothetical protein
MTGAALVLAGLLLPWYATDASNWPSRVAGRTGAVHGLGRTPGAAPAGARRRDGAVRAGPDRPPGRDRDLAAAGWLVAVAGTLVMAGAAARRSAESERPRKPPGTI